jgi:hypothetical protein
MPISTLSGLLPFGLLMLYCAVRVGTADRDPGTQELAALLFDIASGALAVGLWTGPELLESVAERTGSRLRAWAGTGRAFLRPALAAALLLAAARAAFLLRPDDWISRAGLALGGLILAASSFLAFEGAPAMVATWRTVGCLILRLETPAVKPGDMVVAAAELGRPCRNLTASLVLSGDASKEPDGVVRRWTGDASLTEGAGGGWTARAEVRVPDEALPTLDPREGAEDGPWRSWELELVAEGENGAKTVRSVPVAVRS